MAEEGGSYTELASGLSFPVYTAVGLTFGQTYEFKVESRNSYSYSDYSEMIVLLCAFKPDPPTVLTTTNTNDLVTIEWNEPIANGVPITSIEFYILESDGVTYTQEDTPRECDGTQVTLISERTCTISLETLKSSPFDLVKDDSVVVKVITTNSYGDSVFSDAGSGAVI